MVFDQFYSQKDITRLYYYVNTLTSMLSCSTCGKPYVKKIVLTESPDYMFHCNMSCMVNDKAVQARMKATKEKNHTTTKDMLEKTKEKNNERYWCDWYF